MRYLIRRAQAVLHDAMVDALAPHGLIVAQFAVLAALDEVPGLANAELARRTFVTPQTMNVVLRELEVHGLLDRHPHPQHHRILRAQLTAAGRRLLGAAGEAVDEIETRMLAGLSAQAQTRLAGALRACIDALTPGEP